MMPDRSGHRLFRSYVSNNNGEQQHAKLYKSSLGEISEQRDEISVFTRKEIHDMAQALDRIG